jgi:DNA-binding transcriptional MocR family regulator
MLPAGVDGAALQARSIAEGISYARGDFFSIDGRFSDHLSLSFVSQGEDRIEEGVALLGSLVKAAPRAEIGG